MSKENKPFPEAENEIDKGAPLPEDVSPEAAPVEEQPAEGRPPGRFRSFMRRLFRGVIFAAVLILVGMAAAYFIFQQPKVKELDSRIGALEGEKADLESRVQDLEGQVEALSPFEAENKVLRSSIANTDLHVQVLSALKDVQAAQLFLALEQVDSARVSLSRTGDKLDDLRGMLPADQQGVVDGMQQRLALVVEGLDEDAFAAGSDLDVLANSLLQLENTLFTAP